MSRDETLRWIECTDPVLYVRQPEEKEAETDEEIEERVEDEKERSLKDLEKQFLGRLNRSERKILKQIEDRLSTALSAEDLPKLIDELKNQRSEDSGSGDGKSDSKGGEGDQVPAGYKAQMDKLQKQMEKLQKQNEQLADEAQKKEEAMKQERRRHTIEGLLGEQGAYKTDQAYKILSDVIVEDEEIGDAVRVKTEHGDDIIPVKEYIPTFKEENPHLFSTPAKSGSGAGSGGAKSSKPRFNSESLRNPKDGGISWAEYEKNREQIIHDIEREAGR